MRVDDATVRAWSPTDGRKIHLPKPFATKVNAVAVSPDGKLVAAGTSFTPYAGNKTAPGVVRLFNAATWKEVRRIKAHVMLSINPKKSAQVVRELKQMPSVQELHTVSGAYDLIAVISEDSTHDIDATLDRIGGIDGVDKTISSILLTTKFKR